MRYHQLSNVLLAYVVAVTAIGPPVEQPSIFDIAQRVPRSFDQNLRGILSKGVTISHSLADAPRWSEYHEPTPGTIINVATERDVQTVVSDFKA